MLKKHPRPIPNPISDSPSKYTSAIRRILKDHIREHNKNHREDKSSLSNHNMSRQKWEGSLYSSKHNSFRNSRRMDKTYSPKPLAPCNRDKCRIQPSTHTTKLHSNPDSTLLKQALDRASVASLRIDRIFGGCFESSRVNFEKLYDMEMDKLKEQYPKMKVEENQSAEQLEIVELFLKKLNFFHQIQYDGVLRHYETIQLFSSGDI